MPFEAVKPGMVGEDYSGVSMEVVTKGSAQDMLQYDSTDAMAESISEGYASEDDEAVAVLDADSGDTFVYNYEPAGFVVYK